MTRRAETIAVRNVNHPGQQRRVDAAHYNAMKRALLRALPRGATGLTFAELAHAAIPHLPEQLFPGGATADWWAKTVQLDLEANGILERTRDKPLRLRRASGRRR